MAEWTPGTKWGRGMDHETFCSLVCIVRRMNDQEVPQWAIEGSPNGERDDG